MLQLTRTIEGTVMLGDAEGFVPIESADPTIGSMREALNAAAAGSLPSPAGATVQRRNPELSEFGMPIPREELGKLWGIGLNYEAHAGDLGENRPDEPASFMKPKTAAVGPGGPIRLPPKSQTQHVTAEGEIAVIFGRWLDIYPGRTLQTLSQDSFR
jgi:2-keto-4-pentenoate hydratase/2-oxohepta-3-ene-1,7-dioic acid hydratase in catechol pathway